ncbi:MAG: aminotransferase class IV [Saprospiraceae bacterium]
MEYLLETILIKNNRVYNIKYHNERFNRSRRMLFGNNKKINLRKLIDTSKAIFPITKCRITYNNEISNIEYIAYNYPKISSLMLINNDAIEYKYKYQNRTNLKKIFDKKGRAHDIVIVKNDKLTDTYFANIALLKNGKWYTPMSPLLEGTRRAKLIEKKKIIPKDIAIDSIDEYASIVIFNAMIPFGKINITMDNLIK